MADRIYKLGTYVITAPAYPPIEDAEIVLDFIESPRFPDCVSFGSSGGPAFKTSVTSFDSGYVVTNTEWAQLKAQYSVNLDELNLDDLAEVEYFFYTARGRGLGFRYKDWNDYQIANQNFFVGDGSTTQYSFFKRYESGAVIYDRPITKLVSGTVSISVGSTILVEGTDYTIDYNRGLINFAAAPTSNSVGTVIYAEYDVPVRFDTDTLSVSYTDFQQLQTNLPLVEILT